MKTSELNSQHSSLQSLEGTDQWLPGFWSSTFRVSAHQPLIFTFQNFPFSSLLNFQIYRNLSFSFSIIVIITSWGDIDHINTTACMWRAEDNFVDSGHGVCFYPWAILQAPLLAIPVNKVLASLAPSEDMHSPSKPSKRVLVWHFLAFS